MTIASVAQDLYTIQSRKNVPFKTAASILLREELAARFSVYNIVKIVTKSSLLATIAQAKYGKQTPEQKAQMDKEKEQQQRSALFQRYTLSSIANLNRRLTLLSSIVERNNQLVTNLYNEIGSYRMGRRISPQMLSNPRAIKIPLNRSIKGKLDELSAELAELKKIKTIQKQYRQSRPAPKKTKKETESDSTSGLISFLLSNPRLAMTLMGGAGTAIGLGTFAAQIGSLITAPKLIGRMTDRFSGKPGFENPLAEEASQFFDPLLMGAAGYTAVRGGLAATSIGYDLVQKMKAKRLEKQLTERYASGKGPLAQKSRPRERAQRIVQRKSGQIGKWKQLSPALKGIAKRLPAFMAADVAYEIDRMSGYVADHSTNKMNDSQFKENMTNSYAELISTVGIGGVATAFGGIAGTAAFPGLGTAAGLVGGGVLGAIASIYVDEEDLDGVASKVFDMIHRDIALRLESSKETPGTPPVTGSRRRVGRREITASDYARTQVAATPVTKNSGRKLLDYIGNLESQGNYNAVNYTAVQHGYPKSMDLTNKTLAEVLALQAQMIKDGAASSAVGKYQFLQSTLKEEAQNMGLDLAKTKFDPATQDALIYNRLVRMRGYKDFGNNKITAHQFVKNLSMEFASIPDPDTGKSYYQGLAGNKSLVALESIYSAIGASPTDVASAVRLAQSPPALPAGDRSAQSPPDSPLVADTDAIDGESTAITAEAAAMGLSQLSAQVTAALTGIDSRINALENSNQDRSINVRNRESTIEELRRVYGG
mgnify:FL=1